MSKAPGSAKRKCLERGFDRVKAGLYSFVLTRFLHAKRFPLSDQVRGHASVENAMAPKFAVNAHGRNEAIALLFVIKSARNHLRTDRALPHLVLLSSQRDFLKRPDAGHLKSRWGTVGVVKIKRISCVCLTHLRFAARLSRWLCVRPLLLSQSHPLRHGRITAHGDKPTPMTPAITRGATLPITEPMAFATWRAGRDGMKALLH
jgi:hypothetical protein